MKPLFTIHAGEFLVDYEIERRFPSLNVWIPAKDTGVDLLISNKTNKHTISLQVKFSRDYIYTNLRDAAFHTIRAGGWWTPTRHQITNSQAEYWVFVLVGVTTSRRFDFIIIKPDELLVRLNNIHGDYSKKFNCYLWVTEDNRCWETRGLKRAEQTKIANGSYHNDDRDFTRYFGNWNPLKDLSNL